MEPFERLDEAMNGRRLELRMNWRQVADAAGISYTALRAIRRGDYRPTELTMRGLDEALRWAAGSAHLVLDGSEPAPLERQASSAAAEEPAPGSPSLEQELELAARLMAAQVRELGLSPDEAAEAWRRAQERIVRSHEAEVAERHEGAPPEELKGPHRRRIG